MMLDTTNIALGLRRAARADVRRARRQIPLGIAACVFAAAVAGLIAWGM